ncbi:hypothetical protein DD238_006465 [Peronospora effusa]|nr:hypothetical protein DD238_006465 [Peronospora effusa]
MEDCNCRAQNRGLCWKHGGYTRCTVEGCTKRAKSRGICWSHGGGTRCKHGECLKIAVSHGLCWAHGGGKRCLVETCQKPAYERNGNLYLFLKSSTMPVPTRLSSATSLLSPNSACYDLGGYDMAGTTDTTIKNSIDFILDEGSQAGIKLELSSVPGAMDRELRTSVKRCLTEMDASSSKRKKRKARICKEPGCDKYVVDQGLCIRHGGGKRCKMEDCHCRAQNRGLCWKHGGYTICKVESCAKRAKSRGICWSHGGGTRCKNEECSKIAISLGRCWAHGGGKRCLIETCQKPAFERTNNFCTDHYTWYMQHGDPTIVNNERQYLAQSTQ